MGELSSFSTEEILREADDRKAVLRADKRVDEWPDKLGPGGRGGPVDVHLTVVECLFLGGKVELDWGCKMNVRCTAEVTGADGKTITRLLCIDE